MIKFICSVLGVCAALSVSSLASAQDAEPKSRVHEWSLGIGTGLIAVPDFTIGLLMPAGFVSLERRLDRSLALDFELGGHYSESEGDYPWHRAMARAGIGVRHFFLPEARVRPSGYLALTATFARDGFSFAPETYYFAYGPELGAGLDADLAEHVMLRLGSSLLGHQRTYTWGDPELSQRWFGVGLTPRAELRIGW